MLPEKNPLGQLYKTISIIMIIFLLAACGPSPEELTAIDYTPISYDVWPVSNPAEQSLDPMLVARLYYNASRLETIYSLLVFKNGYLIAEDYFHDGSPDLQVNIHSVTKSINSALVGIALEQGCLSSLDQKMMEFFPELDRSDRRSPEETDHHPPDVTDASRLSLGRSYGGRDRAALYRLSPIQPGRCAPRLRSGKRLGIQQPDRPSLRVDRGACLRNRPQVFCPGAPVRPAWHRTGFLAKGLGRQLPGLFRYPPIVNGSWRNLACCTSTTANTTERRLFRQQWVHDSLQIYSKNTWTIRVGRNWGDNGYGYQWWSIRAGNYRYNLAWGHGGQQIALLDDLDMVIVAPCRSAAPKTWRRAVENRKGQSQPGG